MSLLRSLLLSAAFAIPSYAVSAQEESSFIEANILGIFYHELGHAVIHIEEVPIFGQEEDAADVFSIFMIDALFEEEAAQSLAFDAAWGFIGEAEAREAYSDEIPWWDTHGPDEQRFYNTVCIFFGADPDNRTEFAENLGLPEERADYCPEEFDQANNAWGAILDQMTERGAGQTLNYQSNGDSLTEQLLADEIAYLNEQMSLAEPIDVVVESCGEANAFYDPNDKAIIFCSEFESHLEELEKKLN